MAIFSVGVIRDAGQISLNSNMPPALRIYCGALPLCPHPLNYGWLAVTSHCSKLSIIMFIAALSALARGQVIAEETCPLALPSG